MKKITLELNKHIPKDLIDYIVLDYIYDYKTNYDNVINEIHGQLYLCYCCNRFTLEHYWHSNDKGRFNWDCGNKCFILLCSECYENKSHTCKYSYFGYALEIEDFQFHLL